MKFSPFPIGAIFVLGGLATAAPVPVVPPDFGNALQPQLAMADDGSVLVAFGRGEEIFVAASRDGARNFARPVKVGELPKLALGMRRGPRITASGATLAVTAISHATGDLVGFFSTDGGRTWSAAKTINTSPNAAGEGLQGMTAGPNGRVFVTWLDHRHKKMEIYGAESLDGGKNWGDNTLVYHSPEEKVCDCCHPSIAYNANGDLVVMFRNWLDGNRDLWTVTRKAGQTAFASPTRLGENHWKLNACPMDGGMIFPAADGSFTSVWRRDKEVFLTTKTASEIRLGEGTQPVAVASGNVIDTWWQQGPNLMHASTKPGQTAAIFAPNARYPAVVRSPKDGATLVAFESSDAERKGIYLEKVK